MKAKANYIVIIILLIAVCAAGGIYMYKSAQEKTDPVNAMEYLLAETGGAYWADAIREQAHLTVTEFEEEAAVIDTLLCQPLLTGEITYRETENPGVYLLSVDGRDFCLVTLVPSEATAGFGLHYWQIGRTEILDNWLTPAARTVEITGPIDMRIRINDVPVSTAYAEKTDDPDVVLFRMEGILADYQLEVRDGEDNLLTCTDSNGDTYTYTK